MNLVGAYLLGVATLPVAYGVVRLSGPVMDWNRKQPWYKTYCYFYCKRTKKSFESIHRIFSGGYITEKHFRKLVKNYATESQIENAIEKHREAIEIIKSWKIS